MNRRGFLFGASAGLATAAIPARTHVPPTSPVPPKEVEFYAGDLHYVTKLRELSHQVHELQKWVSKWSWPS